MRRITHKSRTTAAKPRPSKTQPAPQSGANEPEKIAKAKKRKAPIPKGLIPTLQDLRRRLPGIANTERWWTTMLSAQERKRLGGTIDSCASRYDTIIDAWKWLHGVSEAMAIVQLAHGIGHLTQSAARGLINQIEEKEGTSDPDAGEVASNLSTVALSGDRNTIIRDKLADRRLVLVRDGDSLVIYWKRERINKGIKATDNKWRFFWHLVEGRMSGMTLNKDYLLRHRIKLSPTDCRYRIKKNLPSDLDAVILSQNQGYFLDVDTSQICLIEVDGGKLKEVTLRSANNDLAR